MKFFRARLEPRVRVVPSDFVSKSFRREYLIKRQTNVAIDTPIGVNIDNAFIVHQIAHEDEALVNHTDERIRAAPPGVAVGDLFKQVWLFVEGLAADFNVHAEVRANVERRVNVDELQPAGVLNLPPERAGFERRENELVVAPNQFVRPAF